MEITPREIALSIAIVLVMVFFGLLIDGAIEQSLMDSSERYYTATHIVHNNAQFEYCMRTNKGLALVEGQLKAITPITHAEINGETLYLEQRIEKYTRHTRQVAIRDKDGETTGYRTEVYYTWDHYKSNEWVPESIEYAGQIFPFYTFDYNSQDLTSWIYDGHSVGSLRWRYYGWPCESNAMVKVNFIDKTIKGEHGDHRIPLDHNTTIQSFIERLESDVQTQHIVFWIIWAILTSGLVYGFYCLENHWLH